MIPASCQFTTAITYGELVYGAAKRGSSALADRVRGRIAHAITILPFDDAAAERHGSLRATLESEGKPLDEPDLRIAAIALSRSLILVTANVRHFERVDGLEIQNWLDPASPSSGQTRKLDSAPPR